MVDQIIPLSFLTAGQNAEVFTVAGLPEHAKRLGELGFRAGARVQMSRQGTPCIVRIDKSRLCCRDCDASSVLVRAEPTG